MTRVAFKIDENAAARRSPKKKTKATNENAVLFVSVVGFLHIIVLQLVKTCSSNSNSVLQKNVTRSTTTTRNSRKRKKLLYSTTRYDMIVRPPLEGLQQCERRKT